MIVYFHNLEEPYVCTFDIEHDNGKLLQFAGIMFKHIGDGLYQVCRNINFYVNQKELSSFITDFLDYDKSFLSEHGIDPEIVPEYFNKFVEGCNDDILFISHGVYQDSIVLKDNGIDLYKYKRQCTYNLSKKVLSRMNKLSLAAVAEECGCAVIDEHNAYGDAIATACIFSYLLKKQGEKQ